MTSASIRTNSSRDGQTLPEPRSAMDPGSEAINLASDALDSVMSVHSLSTVMDSFQSREENDGTGTGVVLYFRTCFDKSSSVEESTHWYAFSLGEDSSSNPNSRSDNFYLPDYPTPPKILQPFSKTYQCRSSGVVGLGCFIYVLGGRLYVKGRVEFKQSNKVYRYNTAKLNATDWEEVAPMNMVRTQFSSAVLDGKIYVQGGLNEGTEIDEIRTNWVEYFDPKIGRWEILSSVKFQGKSLPLFDVLNPPTAYDYFSNPEGYFRYTVTPLEPYELVFSSVKSHFSSYVYNIRDGSLVEMEREKDSVKLVLPYEPPIVLGRTRYYMEDFGNLVGYRFDKFCWVKNSQTYVFSEWKFPDDIPQNYFCIELRADGSSIASQGD